MNHPSLIGPILTLILPFVGHLVTAFSIWAKRIKKPLLVIGSLYIFFLCSLVIIPSVAFGAVVTDNSLTVSEVNQTAWGVYFGCVLCGFGLFACYIAGAILSFREYVDVKEKFKIPKKKQF